MVMTPTPGERKATWSCRTPLGLTRARNLLLRMVMDAEDDDGDDSNTRRVENLLLLLTRVEKLLLTPTPG